MAIYSMTGFARVRGPINEQVSCAVSLKSVNHRFLDLHFRMPADAEECEVGLRRVLRERLRRGHVDVSVSLEGASSGAGAYNRQFVGAYIHAFRAAAAEFGIAAQPDLNVILRLPGALEADSLGAISGFEAVALSLLNEAIDRLNAMRAQEGASIARELRERMARLREATEEVERHRAAVFRSYFEKVQSRMQELLGAQGDRDRMLQEAALLAERSDIQEELVRMKAHVDHFLGLLEAGGEVGKKLDFLLQEMARESNTLLSKTSGIAGEALRITELGLVMKAEIEKAREQVQNIE